MAGDRDPHEPRKDAFDALAEGSLDEQELALLRALADEEPGAQAKLDAFTPLGDDFVNRVTAKVLEARRPVSRRRPGRWVMVGAPIVAAAAIVLFVYTRPSDSGDLPAFELIVRGGEQVMRGGRHRQGPLHLTQETALELELHPEHAIDTDFEVALFARQGNVLRPVDAEIERVPSGAARVRGIAGDLFESFPGGEWTLALVAAPSIPDESTVTRWIGDGDPSVHAIDVTLDW